MKTPHRLIHDAKEAGAITEQEWRAFMRAFNQTDRVELDLFLMANFASEALEFAFPWFISEEGQDYWVEVYDRLIEYEKVKYKEAKK